MHELKPLYQQWPWLFPNCYYTIKIGIPGSKEIVTRCRSGSALILFAEPGQTGTRESDTVTFLAAFGTASALTLARVSAFPGTGEITIHAKNKLFNICVRAGRSRVAHDGKVISMGNEFSAAVTIRCPLIQFSHWHVGLIDLIVSLNNYWPNISTD